MKSKAGGFVEIAIIFMLLYSVTTLYAAIPPLHVEGNRIKDPNGNVVVLRGVDMMDLGYTEAWYGGAIAMIDRLTNKNDAQGSSPGWYTKVIRIMITPPDSVSGWPHPFNPNNNDLYNLLRLVVDRCAQKDVYAIIDWHYIANTYDHVATTSRFWEYMAPRFANDSHVFFELFNEPINDIGTDEEDWLSVRIDMQTLINIVRSYAPNNLILVAGPSYSQIIGPTSSYPLTGDNIVIVSHIYPIHWHAWWVSPDYFKNQITTCAAVYPVFMTEWGFCQSSSYDMLRGTITNYGQPLMDFIEGLKISNSAWVASYHWGPQMFCSDWTLRVGEGEMGGFVKDTLYLRKDDDLPGRSGSNIPPTVSITSLSNWDTFYAGDDIIIEANASDSDDIVTKVEFYQDATTKLGEDTNAPYSYTWNNVPAGRYSVIAKAIDSNGGAKISSAVRISVNSGGATGIILREWWTGIGSRTAVSDLTSDVNYPSNPSGKELTIALEGQIDWANNYGTRIRGYLYPPADGNYIFWISSDDSSELWLSTDADPRHIRKIAYVSGWTDSRQWNKYASQASATISLNAGQKYYIEVLQKEGSGGDNIAVAWQGPGLSQQVIDGVYLSPY